MAESASWVPVAVNAWNDLNARLKRNFDVVLLRQSTDMQTANVTKTVTLNWPNTFIEVDTTAANVVLTLPAARFCTGFVLDVKKMIAANTLTVSSSDGIDAATTVVWSTQYQNYTLICTGAAWRIK